MFTTWGYSPTEATLAVAAGSVFSIGIKLVLPVVAAIGLLVSDTPIDGTLRTIVVIAVLVGVGVLGVAVRRRRRASHRLDRPRASRRCTAFVLRLLRKPDPPDLAETLIDARAESIDRLRDRWMIGTWATVIDCRHPVRAPPDGDAVHRNARRRRSPGRRSSSCTRSSRASPCCRSRPATPASARSPTSAC